MRVRLDDISAGGRRVSAGLDDPWAADAVAEALDGRPTSFSATIRIAHPDSKGRVTVDLKADATAPGICDRCTEDIVFRYDLETSLVYVPEPTAPPPGEDEEVELSEDELDVGWYTDGHLNLSDILSEAFALELPSRIVCDDTAACDARTEALLAAGRADAPGHPAFAALKNLKT